MKTKTLLLSITFVGLMIGAHAAIISTNAGTRAACYIVDNNSATVIGSENIALNAVENIFKGVAPAAPEAPLTSCGVGSVTGTTPICINATANYNANGVVLGGGTGGWSSDNNAIATVNSSGLVTAVSAGTCNIIYTITGCTGTPSAQQMVTVSPDASISGVTGTTPLCIGATATYNTSNVIMGGGTGAWSSDNMNIATVNSSGLVTGISAGTTYIVYSITGCGGAVSEKQLVNILPDANIGSVTGTSPISVGATVTYYANNAVTGGGIGFWNSDNTSIATVNASTGEVTGVSCGTCNIIYVITGGCGGTLSSQQQVTVGIMNNTVTQLGNTLTATATGDSYIWVTCPGYTQIPGATSQSYTVTATGSYAVIVTQSTCSGTSACTPVVITGVNEMSSNADGISIYPNPSSDNIIVGIPEKNNSASNRLYIYNAMGMLVWQQDIITPKLNIDISNFSKGIYLLKIVSGNKEWKDRFVKE